MDADFVITQLLNGLSLTVILALIAFGLSVIFGLMGILNMAHGEFFILGGYAVFWASNAGLSFWASIIVAPLCVGLLGLALYYSFIRRLALSFTATILATWGLSIVIRQVLHLTVGPRARSVPDPITGSVSILSVDYPAYRAFVIVTGAAIIAAVVTLYFTTSIGLQVRAAIRNREMASVLGLNINRINAATFFAGSALAGLAGALLSPLIPLSPLTGLGFLVDSFFVILVGGVGSVLGAPVGGLVIGGGESVLQFGLSPLMAEILILVVAVAIISVRPAGLVAGR